MQTDRDRQRGRERVRKRETVRKRDNGRYREKEVKECVKESETEREDTCKSLKKCK